MKVTQFTNSKVAAACETESPKCVRAPWAICPGSVMTNGSGFGVDTSGSVEAATVQQNGHMTKIRPAQPTDAEEMAGVQNAIYRAGLRASPVDVVLVRQRYLDMEYGIACTVAEQKGRVVGFQSLTWAWPGNPYEVAEGWGIIGTHVHPDAGRSGLGRRLFAASLAAERAAGLGPIDASIGADNQPALAYYSALGFTPYREASDTISHRFDVP